MKTKINIMVSMMIFMNLFIIQSIHAQIYSAGIDKMYRTWFFLNEKGKVITGNLYEVKDSLLMISKSYGNRDFHQGKFDITKLDVRSIDVVKIRK